MRAAFGYNRQYSVEEIGAIVNGFTLKPKSENPKPKMHGIQFCEDLFNNVNRWANVRGDNDSRNRSWQVKRAMRSVEGKRFYLMQNYDTKQWRVVPSDMLGNLY